MDTFFEPAFLQKQLSSKLGGLVQPETIEKHLLAALESEARSFVRCTHTHTPLFKEFKTSTRMFFFHVASPPITTSARLYEPRRTPQVLSLDIG